MQLGIDNTSLTVYKALASETRLEILRRLADTPLTVSELAESLNISKSIMSRHIKLLEDAHLIHQSKAFASSDTRKKYIHFMWIVPKLFFPEEFIFLTRKKLLKSSLVTSPISTLFLHVDLPVPSMS